MAIRERKVKNKRNSQGILTGRPGIVYDVNVKVYENGRQKSIAKRGFATRREAELYEAQIKLELQTGSAAMVGYGPESKQKLKEYLPKWYESYRHNLAKSTQYSYGSDINLYLIPMLGEVPLNKLTPKMIDDMIAQLREKQLAENSVRYCQRILSSALSSAVKYGYIPINPAKNIMTRFHKNAGRKYDKYSVEQVQQLLAFVHGNVLESAVLLSVLFGLRLSEALGLRWRDVNNHKEVLTPDVRNRRLEELSARMRTVRRELNTCADIETDAAALQLKWQEVRQAEKEEREVNENEQRRRSR